MFFLPLLSNALSSGNRFRNFKKLEKTGSFQPNFPPMGWGEGRVGGMVDVNEELKVLIKYEKKSVEGGAGWM